MSEWTEYELWLFRNRLFTLQRLKELYSESIVFKRKPKISIVMPVYNPDPLEFRQAVDSILWQAYPYWELCLVDDLSDNRDYLKIFGRLRDRRIKVYLRDVHTGIAETSRYAVEKATGEYVALMDQDDELYPDALYAFADILQEREVDYFYSDRDMISPGGGRYMHFAKPGWSPEYLLSFNYTPHLEVYNKQFLSDIGGFRKDFEGSQDYDLVLRATELTDRIYHHPMILYSWRQSLKSVAVNPEEKSYAFESGVKALSETVRRRNLPVKEVVENPSLWRGHYRLIWDEGKTDNMPVYIVMVSGSQHKEHTVRQILEPCINRRDVTWASSEDTAKDINRIVNCIAQDGIIFFCDDSLTGVVENGFSDMAGYLSIEGVGAVGSKFTDEDNKIFCCGISITESGKWLLNYRGSSLLEHGYGAVATVPRNVSLVYPAFWGSKVSLIKESGCFNGGETYYSAALRFFMHLRKSGGRIVEVPYMNIKIDTGYAASFADHMNTFLRQWESSSMNDIYYNPNLTDSHEDFSIRI